MKVCLINPPWFTKEGNIWTNIKSTMPSLGLLYIAAYLEREKLDVDVIDFQATSCDWNSIEELIKKFDYDFYGITATTSIVKKAYAVADIIKKYHLNSKVVLGGVHPTSLPEEALSKESIDFVIRGEGEKTFLHLIKGDSLKSIAGLSYKENGAFHHVQPDGIINNLDDLPFPAYHKINLTHYRPAVGAYKRLPAINMLTTRGCPGRCTFCNSANIKLRKRSAENIFQEIKMLSDQYGIKEISFYDDTFTVSPKNVQELCDLLIKYNIDMTWCCFARTDCVTYDMLKKMKSAGCHQVMYGIETADTQILKNIKKNIALGKNKKAIEWAKSAGITVRCTFMFGSPGESGKSIDETINYSIYLDPDISLYNITTPYPGTEMFDWAKKNGYLITEEWDDYDLSKPVMELPTISNKSIQRKYKEAFSKFYFRPTFIVRQIFKIFSSRDFILFYEGFVSIFNFISSKLSFISIKK